MQDRVFSCLQINISEQNGFNIWCFSRKKVEQMIFSSCSSWSKIKTFVFSIWVEWIVVCLEFQAAILRPVANEMGTTEQVIIH